MYQIRYTNGLELCVLGRDLARIDDKNGVTIFTGKYEDCVKYLRDRGNCEAKVQNRAHPNGMTNA